MNVWLLAPLAGGLGAVARWYLAGRIGTPLGTTVVNVVGSFLLGAASTLLTPTGGAWTIVAGGFLGAFTTFSTWLVDVELSAEIPRSRAVNIVGNVALGVGAFLLGEALGWG